MKQGMYGLLKGWLNRHQILSWGVFAIVFTVLSSSVIWINVDALERDQTQEYRNVAAKISLMTMNCVLNNQYDDLLDLMQLQTQSSSVRFIAFYINGIRVLQSGMEPLDTAKLPLGSDAQTPVQTIKRSKFLCLDQMLPYQKENHVRTLRIVFSFEDFDNRKKYILLASGIIVTLFAGLVVILSIWNQTRQRLVLQNGVLVETQAQLKQQEKMKSLMIQSLTHNANNYLNIIGVRIEGMRLQRKSGKSLDSIERDLDVVLENNRAIGNLIKNLNDHERLSKGEVTMSPKREDLARLIRNVVRSFEGNLVKKKMTLNARVPDSEFVWMDSRMVEQVLMNLVINAYNYSPQDTTLEIWTESDPEWVKVFVTDQGVGIEPDAWEKVFEPFVRLNKEAAKGSGLGLTNSRQFIRQLGGELGIFKSQVGVGTTFYFSLRTQESASN
jgi:signal transduction histidine kinase